MQKQRRYSPEYVIAFHFGCDVGDMRDDRYQPTRFVNPKVFTSGDWYYCAVKEGKTPAVDNVFPDRWQWEEIGRYYGYIVYRASSQTRKDQK